MTNNIPAVPSFLFSVISGQAHCPNTAELLAYKSPTTLRWLVSTFSKKPKSCNRQVGLITLQTFSPPPRPNVTINVAKIIHCKMSVSEQALYLFYSHKTILQLLLSAHTPTEALGMQKFPGNLLTASGIISFWNKLQFIKDNCRSIWLLLYKWGQDVIFPLISFHLHTLHVL